MDQNQAADAWCASQATAKSLAGTLSEGDYWYRWDEVTAETEPSEMVAAELCVVLRSSRWRSRRTTGATASSPSRPTRRPSRSEIRAWAKSVAGDEVQS